MIQFLVRYPECIFIFALGYSYLSVMFSIERYINPKNGRIHLASFINTVLAILFWTVFYSITHR
jgi:hypothetical protein